MQLFGESIVKKSGADKIIFPVVFRGGSKNELLYSLIREINNFFMEKNLILESKIESLHLVEKIIDEISDQYKLAGKYYGNILIASLESVQNAIVHGNKQDARKFVEVSLKIKNNLLIFTTKDQGDGFDYNNVPDPTAPENIGNIAGMGTFLMRKLSDELNFYEEGRIAELVFKI